DENLDDAASANKRLNNTCHHHQVIISSEIPRSDTNQLCFHKMVVSMDIRSSSYVLIFLLRKTSQRAEL
ncbi:unnamed protein product, partial [Musa acuminata subsp. burmannicoides]